MNSSRPYMSAVSLMLISLVLGGLATQSQGLGAMLLYIAGSLGLLLAGTMVVREVRRQKGRK